MDKAQFDKICSREFDKMDKRVATVRGFVSPAAWKRLYMRGVWAYSLGVLGAGILSGLVFSTNLPGVFLSALLSLLGGAIFAAACMAYSTYGEGRDGVMESIINAFFAMKKRSLPLTPEQAYEIAKWAHKYPRIDQACVRWGAVNEERTLSRADLVALEKHMRVIGRAEKAHEEYQQEMRHQVLVNEAINRNGMIDRMKVLGDAQALEANTPAAAVGTSAARRI